jgi:hypothetical protein
MLVRSLRLPALRRNAFPQRLSRQGRVVGRAELPRMYALAWWMTFDHIFCKLRPIDGSGSQQRLDDSLLGTLRRENGR